MIGHRQLTMEDYAAILRRHKRTLILLAILGPAVGYLLCFVLPKEYTSQTVVLVEQPAVPTSYVTDISTGDSKQRLTTLQEQILSRSRLEAIIDKFGLYQKERTQQASKDALVDRLRKKISVTPVKPMAESNSSQLPGFIIKVTDRDPALAQKMCNEVASVFMGENQRVRHEQAKGTTVFLTKQLEDAKAKREDQEPTIAASQDAPAADTAPAAGADTPEIQQLRAQVHQYDSILKEKTAQQRDIQRQIGQYQSRLQLSPNVEEQYKQLTRDYQSAADFYNDLLKKRSESAMVSDMNHQTENAEFRILDPANLPDSPSFPNPLFFSLGGLAVGLVKSAAD